MKRTIKRNVKADTTLFEAFEEFIFMKEANGISEATISNYRTTFKIFCKFFDFNEDTPAEDIKESDIYKWIGTMRIDYPITSINHYLRDVRAILYYCMDKEYMPSFKIQLVKGQEEKIKFFEDGDVEKLLEKPRKKDEYTTWRSWAIVNWILATGNRSSTVCNVKIGDVNFRRKEITITATKNKKLQIIPLSNALETVLKDFIKMWRNEAGDDEYLFCNYGGEKLTTNASRQAFEKFCNDREVSQHNLHGLRHSYARGMVRNGANVYTIQNIMGHSSLEMTKKYVRLYSEDLKNDYEEFSPLDVLKKKASRRKGVNKNI